MSERKSARNKDKRWKSVEEQSSSIIFFLFFIKKCSFLRFYLFISRETGREGERKGEKHQCVVTSSTALTGYLAHNPGMYPDWE